MLHKYRITVYNNSVTNKTTDYRKDDIIMMNELKMQIEFINYTKDLSCDEQSVFYFEDLMEAIEWKDEYFNTHKDDEIGLTYFKIENVDMIRYETLESVEEFLDENENEIEKCIAIIDHGYANTLNDALEFYNDHCYVMHGYSELDAFEEYLEEICYFENVPEHIRHYIDIDAIKRDFEYSGDLTIIKLPTEAGYCDYLPIYQYLFIAH